MAKGTPKSAPGISIVIVNYNGAGFVERAVASALSGRPSAREIILVDNGSTDGSGEHIQQNFPGVRVIRFSENRGFAEGANEGYRAARYPVVAFVNSDACLPPNWPEVVSEEFARDPDLVCLTTAVRNAGETETSRGGATYSVLGARIPGVWEDDTRVWGPSGAAFAVNKERFPLSAPFPSHFFVYYEDFVLGSVLRHRRLKVRKVSTVTVEHEGSRTASRLSRNRIRFYQERNRVASLVATYSARMLVRLVPLYLLDGLLRLGRSVVHGDFPGFVMAHIHLTFSLRSLAKLRRMVRGDAPVPDRELCPFLSGKIHPRTPFLNSLSLMYFRLVRLPVAELSARKETFP